MRGKSLGQGKTDKGDQNPEAIGGCKRGSAEPRQRTRQSNVLRRRVWPVSVRTPESLAARNQSLCVWQH